MFEMLRKEAGNRVETDRTDSFPLNSIHVMIYTVLAVCEFWDLPVTVIFIVCPCSLDK